MILDLGAHRFDVTHRALVMGVLGLSGQATGGHRHRVIDDHLAAAEKLIDDGADCLDVGCIGSKPDRWPSLQEELQYVVPLIKALRSRFELPLSVRSRRAEVLGQCLGHGADAGHDPDGFGDGDYLAVASSFGASVVAATTAGVSSRAPVAAGAHRRGDGQAAEGTHAVLSDLTARAAAAGIPKERILIDTGLQLIGPPEVSANAVDTGRALLELGYPLLLSATDSSALCRLVNGGRVCASHVGPSAGGVAGCDVSSATTAANVTGITRGCRVIRTDDVQAGRRVADMMAEILTARTRA